jgi:hypothetical protein
VASTKSSGTILNSRRLALSMAKGEHQGRCEYKIVWNDFEQPEAGPEHGEGRASGKMRVQNRLERF